MLKQESQSFPRYCISEVSQSYQIAKVSPSQKVSCVFPVIFASRFFKFCPQPKPCKQVETSILQGTITYPTKRDKENHRLKHASVSGICYFPGWYHITLTELPYPTLWHSTSNVLVGAREGSSWWVVGCTCEPRKKPSYFPLNPGWLIGILIMVYYNPHITG